MLPEPGPKSSGYISPIEPSSTTDGTTSPTEAGRFLAPPKQWLGDNTLIGTKHPTGSTHTYQAVKPHLANMGGTGQAPNRHPTGSTHTY